ncbi:MAG: sensor histidine kinase [Chitinophagaceae bacterium]
MAIKAIVLMVQVRTKGNFTYDMNRYPFIFSNEPKYRLRRHLYFWLFWWLFQGFLYSFVAAEQVGDYFIRLPLSFVESFIYLAAHIFLAYYLIYFVIPRFLLRQRYWSAGLLCLAGFLISAAISSFLNIFVIKPIRIWSFPEIYAIPRYSDGLSFYLSLMAGLRGSITIGGLAAAIKLMKTLFLKEQRNSELQKQHIASQLRLLQAQVHPHFLFNTLNNIYAETQANAPKAAAMVSGLSALLRFILYESDKPVIELHREIRMIEDYVNLERIRYGNEPDIQFNRPAETGNTVIAPLLLLPFVENAFKHGASQMLDQPWISIQIELDNNRLYMKVMNGKPPRPSRRSETSGIGIENVQKRLQFLYPGKHQLQIVAEEDVFIVNLKIELEQQPATHAVLPANLQLT